MSNLTNTLTTQTDDNIACGNAAATGEYKYRTNGGEWESAKNLITNEGLNYILNTAFGSKPKASNFYVALFSGTAAPDSTWTAASFSATANEIVSLTEGYTNATRPEWKPTDTTTQRIDNNANVAKVTIATAGTLTVTGMALLTASGKGSTTGTLISAFKFPTARVFQSGDIFEVGYFVGLTV